MIPHISQDKDKQDFLSKLSLIPCVVNKTIWIKT